MVASEHPASIAIEKTLHVSDILCLHGKRVLYFAFLHTLRTARRKRATSWHCLGIGAASFNRWQAHPGKENALSRRWRYTSEQRLCIRVLWFLENAIKGAFFNDTAAIHDRYATRQSA